MADSPVALVIGGTSGIVSATAQLVASQGASVIIARWNEQQGEALARSMGARFARVDVRDTGRIEALFETVERQHGRLNVLVNTAGVAIPGHARDVAPKHWQRPIDINSPASSIAASRPFRCSNSPPIGVRLPRSSMWAPFLGEAAISGLPDFLQISAQVHGDS